MRVEPGGLQAERLHGGRDFHDWPWGPVGLQAGLRPRRPQDRLVESGRRLFEVPERRDRLPRALELLFLRAARGAALDVRLDLRGARRGKLAVDEVQQQVLGLGAVHALPNRTPAGGSGSGSASSTVTPWSASALRNATRA